MESVNLNAPSYRTTTPAYPYAEAVIKANPKGLRTGIDVSEIGKQWVLAEWKEWAKTLERFIVVAPNFCPVDKVKTLDEMVAEAFGDKGRTQIGNEPDFRCANLNDDPEHPWADEDYLDWVVLCWNKIRKNALLPAMGCYKDEDHEIAELLQFQAWRSFMDKFPGAKEICFHVYPWSDDAPIKEQLASMRRQIAMGKAVASLIGNGARLVITEIGRPGGAPTGHLTRGIEAWTWGMGHGDVYEYQVRGEG